MTTQPQRKYGFTGEKKLHCDRILRRIYRLSDDLTGGWIEKEKNLSHEGDCFIYEKAMVYGNACVQDNAKVSGHAKIAGSAILQDQAHVTGRTWVTGRAMIRDRAVVKDPVCATTLVSKTMPALATMRLSEDVLLSVVRFGCAERRESIAARLSRRTNA
jgi:hypothetical protein